MTVVSRFNIVLICSMSPIIMVFSSCISLGCEWVCCCWVGICWIIEVAVPYCCFCDVSAAEYDVSGLVYVWGCIAKVLQSSFFLSGGKVRFCISF